MNSPDTERVLSALKDFQRDTVDYAFNRMYVEAVPSTRFLIADEVGLGKTKVAAGIVARATDFLRDKDPDRRIDVIYICSNSSIARQNINRLNVTRQPCHDLPDRITLLPRDISRLSANKVNFIAFTPGTSLNMRSSGGKAEERALLYWLLPADWKANAKGSVSLLTGGMRRDRFQARVDEHEQRFKIDEKLTAAFQEKVNETRVAADSTPARSLRERFLELADQLGGRSEKLTDDEWSRRADIVGTLRSMLAGVCVDSLEPDLVILDEFQRFSDLLNGTDDASRLAQQLFHYRNDGIAHGDVRVLLLSATPYRMFTTADDPGASGHYADLIQTIGFLQNDPARTQEFEKALGAYGQELFRIGQNDGQALRAARDDVAIMLRRVMVRTERLAVTADRSGMLKEVPCQQVRVTERDVQSFLALQSLARSLDTADVTEYWKSAPYLVNFMDEYDIKRDFVDAVEGPTLPPQVLAALSGNTGALLSKQDVDDYRALDPSNARLRNLVHDMLDSEAWRMLWIPSSWNYYQPDGEFAVPAARTLTKRLIFSSWQVVPKVVAALMTYEAERRMLDVHETGEPGGHASDARKGRGSRLKFSSGDRLSGMQVLGLMYPSFVLASDVDPRSFAPADVGGTASLTLQEVLGRARVTCERLLEEITGDLVDGPEDVRWYWAAPILLDARRDPVAVKAWFGQTNLAGAWRGVRSGVAAGDPEADEDVDPDAAWAAHVAFARDLEKGQVTLGRPPKDLAEVMALSAIGGPATAALRAIARVSGGLQRVTDKMLRNEAGQVAEGFRSLFNQPDVTVMLQRVNDDEPYWRRVLEYCARGGLQAVLDEFAHVLSEHLGVAASSPAKIEQSIAKVMAEALTLRTANVAADSVEVDETAKTVRIGEKMRFRTRFAVRYGGRDLEDTQSVLRAGDVQKAFNSPFWPFVLCSTSVGQEGLDFHLYCHAVMHWNLPSNPVDLEQREGRIHRYKGHAVRKNVARDFARGAAYTTTGPDSDSWRNVFASARRERKGQDSDLVPFWVYTTEGGAQIERHLPMIPLSKDVDKAEGLRRSLAVYRMAFGQSRQDDLVEYLQRYLTSAQIDEAVAELRIDLTPGRSPDRKKSGQAQVPGDLAGDDGVEAQPVSEVDLAGLEDLLNAFALVRPAVTHVPIEALSRLLDDFAAIRNA